MCMTKSDLFLFFWLEITHIWRKYFQSSWFITGWSENNIFSYKA
jgi:hypothetical protein